MNVTLSGDKASAQVINVRWGLQDWGGPYKRDWQCPYKWEI